MNFCCLVTKSYIPNILSTFKSINRFNKNYMLYILIIDDDNEIIDLPNVKQVKLYNILHCEDDIILKIFNKYNNYKRIGNDKMRKNNPTDIIRYSMKVCLIYFLLKYINLSSVVWIDPDLYFVKDIDNIFELLKTKDVILTPHFRNEYNCSNRHLIYRDGFFNVGFIGFKQNSVCLNWYIQQIYLTCDLIDGYYYYEQKYLDYFPILTDNIVILREGNYNLSEWNMDTCKRIVENDKLYIEKNNLKCEPVFFHFTGYYINEIIRKNKEVEKITEYLHEYERDIKIFDNY